MPGVVVPPLLTQRLRMGQMTPQTVLPVAAQRLKQLRSGDRWPLGSQASADKALREACEWDQERFVRHFFPALCTDPFNAMHRDFFAEHQVRKGGRGYKDVTAAPRGSAKTSIKGKAAILHDILYTHERYIAICSANDDLARDKVKDIRDELDSNAELIRVYGPQATREWRQSDFVTQTGCRVRSFTPKSKVRGFLWRNLRPTKIVLDDAEDAETCLTPLRRERFVAWYNNEVTKLGTAETNYEIIGTILHPESLLAQLLKNPGYRAKRYQAVIAFAHTPAAWEKWREWREILCDLENDNRLKDARAFYEAHEHVMLEGTEVLWPERASETYYALMLDRVIHGEAAFWQERQNDPQADASYLFDVDGIARCTVGPEGVTRDDGRYVRWLDMRALVAYYDPTVGVKPTTQHDFAACPVVMRDRHGYSYCVDTYLEQTDHFSTQIEAIVDLCWRWQVEKLGVEAVGFQAQLVNDFQEAFAQRSLHEGRQWSPLLVPVKQTRQKQLRIRQLQPALENHWLFLSDKLPAQAWQQLGDFTTLATDNIDDFPDGLSGAMEMLDSGEV